MAEIIKSFNWYGMEYRHGDSIECMIDGTNIEKGKISISHSDTVYICQNVITGANASDKLGYDYSYFIGTTYNLNMMNITKLKKITTKNIIEKTKESGIERNFLGFDCRYTYTKDTITIVDVVNGWEYKSTYFGKVEDFLPIIDKAVYGKFLELTDKRVNEIMEEYEKITLETFEKIKPLHLPVTKEYNLATIFKTMTSVSEKLEKEFKGSALSNIFNKFNKNA